MSIASLTRLIPDIPHASGIYNRIVKPLLRPKGTREIAPWPGIRMEVDVGDSLGGMLAYIPQLYDRWERECVLSHLHEGATFVDAGSNIGVYALWAAKLVGDNGTVVAIEAEPRNYRRLVTNIALNGMTQRIKAFNVGVSDRVETLPLYLTRNDNSGGHTFSESVHTKNMPDTISVSCRPLMSLLEQAKVTRVDFMKLDIEGFEQRVLSQFFRDAAENSSFRPGFILCEFYWGRSTEPGSLDHVLEQNGYVLLEEKGTNALYGQIGRDASALGPKGGARRT